MTLKPQGSECECMNGCGKIFTSEQSFDLHFVNWKCGDVKTMVYGGGINKGEPLFRAIERRGGIVWSRNRPDLPGKEAIFGSD